MLGIALVGKSSHWHVKHVHCISFGRKLMTDLYNHYVRLACLSKHVASQSFLVSGGPFCLSSTFIFRNERNWMKKSARVSEKLVSPGLPGSQVATRLLSLGHTVEEKKRC